MADKKWRMKKTGVLSIDLPAVINDWLNMKTKWLSRMFLVFLISAAVVCFVAGCASMQMKSFNQDFGEKFPASPQYAIENIDDNHFRIHLNQGEPLSGPDRVIYMKKAAIIIADAEGKRRGWERWDLNYIQERDQGWMHVLIATVDRTK